MPDTHRLSQADRILHLLEAATRYASVYGDKYKWITLPQMLSLSIANYRARISELRQAGHHIECHRETVDGQVRTKYRLVKA